MVDANDVVLVCACVGDSEIAVIKKWIEFYKFSFKFYKVKGLKLEFVEKLLTFGNLTLVYGIAARG